MRYVISYKWTDPSTGKYTIEKVCECDDMNSAHVVKEALEKTEAKGKDFKESYEIEPYGKRENLLLCVDPHQIEVAWQCQNWLQVRGVRPIICFSMVDLTQIRDIYTTYGVPHMVAVVSQDKEKWQGLDYDLNLSEFEQDDFETILSVME